VKVSVVEVKDVELPSSMQRALARQAEAERERRAKIIAADGEYQASEKLSQAANVIAAAPSALQLRYMQTIAEIGASDKTSTLIIPFPTEMLELIRGIAPSASVPGNGGPPETGR
jgi:regulator of protease activity HflC (stomatin/prohibitin superfamily)